VARQAIRVNEEQFDTMELISQLEEEMHQAAEELEFEKAARLRDRIAELKEQEHLGEDEDGPAGAPDRPPRKTGRRGRQMA
jgi:excinuclease ABC subunit B